jgi:hypothetical protein
LDSVGPKAGDASDAVPLPEAEWAFVQSRSASCTITRISSASTSLGETVMPATTCILPRAAAKSDFYRIIWQAGEGDGGIAWTHAVADSTPDALVGDQLALSGHHPQIVSTEEGFAAVWRTAEGFSFMRSDDEGVAVCGPVSTEFGNGEYSESDGAAVVETPDGAVVLATDVASNEALLFRFDSDCEQNIAPAPVTEAPMTPQHPELADGVTGVLAAWIEAGPQGHTRLFGPSFCD